MYITNDVEQKKFATNIQICRNYFFDLKLPIKISINKNKQWKTHFFTYINFMGHILNVNTKMSNDWAHFSLHL